MVIGIWKSASKILGGTGLGYLILLLLTPVMTRLYSPEVFGLFSIFSAVVAIGSVLLGQSLEMRLLSAEKIGKSYLIAQASVVFATLASLIALVCTTFVWVIFPASFSDILPYQIFVLGIISCWIAVVTTLGMNWAIRRDRSGLAATSTFVNLSSRSSLQTIFGASIGGLHGLVLGEVLGRLAGWFTVERGIVWRSIKLATDKPAILKQTYLDNKNYPIYVMPAIAMDSVLFWLPAPLFTLAFGIEVGGLVAMVHRLAAAPLTLANQSIAQLFHVIAAKNIRDNAPVLTRFILKFSLVITAIALPVAAILAMYGSDLATLVFGSLWSKAGIVALILAPMYTVQVVNLLALRIFLISESFKIRLYLTIINIFLLIASVFLGDFLGRTWIETLILQSTLQTLSYVCSICLAIYKLRQRARLHV